MRGVGPFPDEPPGANGAPLDLDILPDLVGYVLRRAQVAVYQDFARTVGSLDIRPAQFAALVVIGANPGLNQTSLAATLGIDRSGVVVLIDALEAKELAVRRPSPVDRRTYAIVLTAAGQALLARLKQAVSEHDRRATAALDAAERRQLTALLMRLHAPPGDG